MRHIQAERPQSSGSMAELLTYQATPAKTAPFIRFWATQYSDPREALYTQNIGPPLTGDKIRSLFVWKNGGKLSERKRSSVERNYVSRLDEALGVTEDGPRAFLDRFPDGGAIWRIFFLHCCWPHRYPIYDMHVHRAMSFIESDGTKEELGQYNDTQKTEAYLSRYLPFHQSRFGSPRAEVDRALWTFGRFIREWKL